MARIFILSDDDPKEAWRVADDYAAQLRAQNLTPSHRIAVESRAHTFWVVLVIDEPEEEGEK